MLRSAPMRGAPPSLEETPRPPVSRPFAMATLVPPAGLPAITALLTLLLACGPSSSAPGLQEAARLRADGRNAEAARLLAPLARRFPQDSRVRYALAEALHAGGQDRDALPEIDAALRADPKSLDARVLRGAILGELGRDDEALQQLREVVAADPSRAGVHR